MRKKLLIKRIAFSTLSVVGVGTTVGTSVLLVGKLNTAKDDRGSNNDPNYPGGSGSGFNPNDSNNGHLGTNSNGKFNYVALGDSIAAGYTLFNGQDNNYVDYNAKDHATAAPSTIYGDSYSAWLARSFKKNGMLGAYDNLAVGGYTTGNLLSSMDDLYVPNSVDKSHLAMITNKGKFDDATTTGGKKNPAAFMTRTDWNNYYNNENKIKSTIKKADLVTVTIGANDMINLLSLLGHPLLDYMSGGVGIKDIETIIGNIMHPPKGHPFDFNTAVGVDPSALETVFHSMEANTKKVISTIKTLNPHAKIALVGYEMPLMQLRNVLDLAIVNHQILVEQIISQLNQTMKSIANQYKSVDYINTDNSSKFLYNNSLSGNVPLPSRAANKNVNFDPKLVLNNYNPASWYMPVSYDIHPGPYGYRSAAASILSGLISKDTNTDPDSSLVNKSEQRIVPNEPQLKSFTADIKSFNNPFADLSSYKISKATPDSVAYLQPQIAKADLYSGKGKDAPTFAHATEFTALDNALSDVNNILLVLRNKIATAINDANSDATTKFADLKAFAQKYAPSVSGKATVIKPTDISFDILKDFGKLKENIIDPSAKTDNSEYLIYTLVSGMTAKAGTPEAKTQDPLSATATGFPFTMDLLQNLDNLDAFNIIAGILPFIPLPALVSSDTPNALQTTSTRLKC